MISVNCRHILLQKSRQGTSGFIRQKHLLGLTSSQIWRHVNGGLEGGKKGISVSLEFKVLPPCLARPFSEHTCLHTQQAPSVMAKTRVQAAQNTRVPRARLSNAARGSVSCPQRAGPGCSGRHPQVKAWRMYQSQPGEVGKRRQGGRPRFPGEGSVCPRAPEEEVLG